MRKVIVHYHLFKNAGSSVDGLLSKSFGDKWHAFDPTDPAGRVTAESLAKIIEENGEYDAFSSHSIVPPLPEGNFEVFPLVVLRDPIARVMSAYKFEWKKQLGLDKIKGSLTEYIQDKFSKPRANAIEEFQTFRLAVSNPSKTSPMLDQHDEVILNQAKAFIASLPAFGLVEDFSSSLVLFEDYLLPYFPNMKFENKAQNVTTDISVPIHERHEAIKSMIGDDTFAELISRNQLDIKLHAFAQGRFEELLRQAKKRNGSEGDTQSDSESVDVNLAESTSDDTDTNTADVDNTDQVRANG